MYVALFLFWSFGFWLLIGIVEFAFMKGLGTKPFLLNLNKDTPYVLTLVWIIGMVGTFRLIRHKEEGYHERDQAEEEDVDARIDPNTLVIVEAPNRELAEVAGAEYIESETYFDALPAKGKRLVLNAPDDDDSNILGTVDEAAEGAHDFGDEKIYRVWVRLDRPEDYAELRDRIGWDVGLGAKRRSTSPVIESID